jgi:hypothetical protein
MVVSREVVAAPRTTNRVAFLNMVMMVDWLSGGLVRDSRRADWRCSWCCRFCRRNVGGLWGPAVDKGQRQPVPALANNGLI